MADGNGDRWSEGLARLWALPEEPPREEWAERRRLADALRALISQAVLAEAPPEALREIVADLERHARTLAAHRGRSFSDGMRTGHYGEEPGFYADRSSFVGRANPIAPPMAVRSEGARALGAVTFTQQYEGAPGVVHGGFVAAVLDQLFGYTVCLHDIPSMTGSLTVRYKRPTPLHKEIRLEADLVRDEGRRVTLEGRAYDGETLLAEGEALFIRLRDDHYKPAEPSE